MNVRRATEADLPDVLRLLFEDRATPSDELLPDAPCYASAFREMQASETNGTYVAEEGGRIVGTFQLTFIRHLLRRGGLVAEIESVRVDARVRRRGYGGQGVRWPSRKHAAAAAAASSSPRTSRARTRTGSTSGSGSMLRT